VEWVQVHPAAVLLVLLVLVPMLLLLRQGVRRVLQATQSPIHRRLTLWKFANGRWCQLVSVE
jgi:hypothetical protein